MILLANSVPIANRGTGPRKTGALKWAEQTGETMNYSDRFLRETASYSVLDVLLIDVAVRIQLTPSDYQKAVEHYGAINEWIDREDSPLHGLVQLFYPQGSFMIGATIARHASDAEFDIDVMAQIDWPA